jgi:membrane dipeptidase
MKVFDLHADIACAIEDDAANGEKTVLRDHWKKRFSDGELTWSAAASFFAGKESWEDMVRTVKMVSDDIGASEFKKILSPEDLNENQDGTAFMMTIEGMCGIHDHVSEKIQWLYDQGNRIGSLEWNDQNDLATGNSGDPCRGLTQMGFEAVKKMNELHFILDVSHANEYTFWDVLSASSLPILATHSNAKHNCFHERNLTDQQLRAVAEKDGLVGMNSCAPFISEKAEEQDAMHLAEHARYIADLIGVEHVACGFDFGGYYSEKKRLDLGGPEDTQNFIHALNKVGFGEEDIRAIAYGNVFRFLRRYM